MPFTDAQQLFTLVFAIHFTLIIDRVHKSYNPYDTYNAWKGKPHAIKRLLLSWLIMYIFPLLNFAAFLLLLGMYGVSFEPNLHGVLNIVLVALSSFSQNSSNFGAQIKDLQALILGIIVFLRQYCTYLPKHFTQRGKQV